jgi:uncharacterized damage-inducible protein DinB
MNRLRKEFLIWHTFTDDDRAHHRGAAAEMLDESARESQLEDSLT